VTERVALALPAVTVTTPDREDDDVFAEVETVIVAPSPPEEGEMVSHDWLDDADHDVWFVVTATGICDASPRGAHCATDSDTLGAVVAPAAWVTTTVELAPPAVKVTVPDRDDDEVLAATETVAEPPLEPEVGATVSHD